jgi:hypothetical protein
MFGRKPPPTPCPACAAKDVHIASLERQLALVNERLYGTDSWSSVHNLATPTAAEWTAGPDAPWVSASEEEPEPLSQTITNAMARRATAGTPLWTEVEEQARLYLAEGLSEGEIVRRIVTGDWEGLESAEANAEGMR